MVAAILHDVGKGEQGDHSCVGEKLAADEAVRLGFGPRGAALVARLVRWHLLLPEVATTRDLDDPATIRSVLDRVRDEETLELLAALTEADARATSPQAWTPWRAGLVAELVRRVGMSLRPAYLEEAESTHSAGK